MSTYLHKWQLEKNIVLELFAKYLYYEYYEFGVLVFYNITRCTIRLTRAPGKIIYIKRHYKT